MIKETRQRQILEHVGIADVCQTCPHNLLCLSGKQVPVCHRCGQTRGGEMAHPHLANVPLDTYLAQTRFFTKIQQRLTPIPAQCPLFIALAVDPDTLRTLRCSKCRDVLDGPSIQKITKLNTYQGQIYLRRLRKVLKTRTNPTTDIRVRLGSLLIPTIRRAPPNHERKFETTASGIRPRHEPRARRLRKSHSQS